MWPKAVSLQEWGKTTSVLKKTKNLVVVIVEVVTEPVWLFQNAPSGRLDTVSEWVEVAESSPPLVHLCAASKVVTEPKWKMWKSKLVLQLSNV